MNPDDNLPDGFSFNAANRVIDVNGQFVSAERVAEIAGDLKTDEDVHEQEGQNEPVIESTPVREANEAISGVLQALQTGNGVQTTQAILSSDGPDGGDPSPSLEQMLACVVRLERIIIENHSQNVSDFAANSNSIFQVSDSVSEVKEDLHTVFDGLRHFQTSLSKQEEYQRKNEVRLEEIQTTVENRMDALHKLILDVSIASAPSKASNKAPSQAPAKAPVPSAQVASPSLQKGDSSLFFSEWTGFENTCGTFDDASGSFSSSPFLKDVKGEVLQSAWNSPGFASFAKEMIDLEYDKTGFELFEYFIVMCSPPPHAD